jgi:hypothetical protein
MARPQCPVKSDSAPKVLKAKTDAKDAGEKVESQDCEPAPEPTVAPAPAVTPAPAVAPIQPTEAKSEAGPNTLLPEVKPDADAETDKDVPPPARAP